MNFLEEIKTTFDLRYKNRNQGLFYKKLFKEFPAILENNTDKKLRPSLLFTKKGGDLGLAILWIVQASLINPILQKIENNDSKNFILQKIKKSDYTMGALANSEDKDAPIIKKKKNPIATINGIKKYI